MAKPKDENRRWPGLNEIKVEDRFYTKPPIPYLANNAATFRDVVRTLNLVIERLNGDR